MQRLLWGREWGGGRMSSKLEKVTKLVENFSTFTLSSVAQCDWVSLLKFSTNVVHATAQLSTDARW